jgi:hypothetical protein
MGIDVSLHWDGMTADDCRRQTCIDQVKSEQRKNELQAMIDAGCNVTPDMRIGSIVPLPMRERGAAGYIRESYAVSPHPAAILVREAFASDDGWAPIPAAVMRERLYAVTEPASHTIGAAAAKLFDALEVMATIADAKTSPHADWTPTRPASVWECVQERVANGTAAGGTIDAAEMMSNYIAFVELAERREQEQGHPCLVYVCQ